MPLLGDACARRAAHSDPKARAAPWAAFFLPSLKAQEVITNLERHQLIPGKCSHVM
jgi:hypothetical protein